MTLIDDRAGVTAATTQRLAAVRDSISSTPSLTPAELEAQCWSLLEDHEVDVATRAQDAWLVLVGCYPTLRELRDLTDALTMGSRDAVINTVRQGRRHAGRAAALRTITPATEVVVDVTRTSRAAVRTGIPRVALALAQEASQLGAASIVWERGSPGIVSIAGDGSVHFPIEVWPEAGRSRWITTRLQRAYWNSLTRLSRLTGDDQLAITLRDLLHPLVRRLFNRNGPRSMVLLTHCRYVSPEVTAPEVIDRLLPCTQAMPGFEMTVVVHDLLPITRREFFQDRDSVGHLDFARQVAASRDVVVSSDHLVLRVIS